MKQLSIAFEGKKYTSCWADWEKDKVMRIVADEVFGSQVYASERCTIRPGSIVVDGGAHVGMFTLYALHRGAGLVLASEPKPHTIWLLKRTLGYNNVGHKVVVSGKVLWDSVTEVPFKYYRNNSVAARVVAEGAVSSGNFPTDTIDNLARGCDVGFIKLDVEGSELKVLQGALETIRRCRPNMAVSLYHKEYDKVEIPNFINCLDMGYTYDVAGDRCIVGRWTTSR